MNASDIENFENFVKEKYEHYKKQIEQVSQQVHDRVSGDCFSVSGDFGNEKDVLYMRKLVQRCLPYAMACGDLKTGFSVEQIQQKAVLLLENSYRDASREDYVKSLKNVVYGEEIFRDEIFVDF